MDTEEEEKHLTINLGRDHQSSTLRSRHHVKSNLTQYIAIFAVITGIVLYGVISHNSSGYHETETRSYHDLMLEMQQEINPRLIGENLQVLTEKPHVAGSHQDEVVLVDFIRERWNEYLDDVQVFAYNVSLSYPNHTDVNYLSLSRADGTEVFKTSHQETPLTTAEEEFDVIHGFNSYSPAGDVTGRLHFVNYARMADFEYLESRSVKLDGSICIAKYGKMYRGDKALLAALFNCSGLVLYSDPADYAGYPKGSWSPDVADQQTFPDSWWLPKDGFQRGSLYINGDPSTPNYPSLDFSFREELQNNKRYPQIPVHPISYNDAYMILEALDGASAPSEWHGGFNMTYKIGGSFKTKDISARLHVANYIATKTIHNVFGTIHGSHEPDRFIFLGNHRDAWNHGGLDPSSGTAVMIEMSRVMGQAVKEARWRPRRSIMFCSWGAEEHGLLGSTEWVEQMEMKLMKQAVAYVNIDIAVQGSATFRSSATPSLYNLLYESTSDVANPNVSESALGRPSVYDTWLKILPDVDRPFIRDLGSGSDYTGFLQKVGVPSIDMRYTYEEKLSSYPVYHSMHDTYDYLTKFLDPSFHYSAAVGQVGLNILMRLSSSIVLPLNPLDYASKLQRMLGNLKKNHGSSLQERDVSLQALDDCVRKFSVAAAKLMHQVSLINESSSALDVRRVNDVLFNIDKGFLDFNGIPRRPEYRHVVFAPSMHDIYSGTGFPAVSDALFEAARGGPWDNVKRQLSFLSQHILQAAQLMDTSFW